MEKTNSAMMATGTCKLVLTLHILLFSVGWFGAVIDYLSLAITGLATIDDQMVRVVYPAFALVGWYVIVPSSLGVCSVIIGYA